jgi:hypothetical protein
MAVRIEKIIATMLNEAHRWQVSETLGLGKAAPEPPPES